MKSHLIEQLAALTIEQTAVSLVLPASQDTSLTSRTISEPDGQRHLASTDPHGVRTNHHRSWRNAKG
jgi:hypothetical protein